MESPIAFNPKIHMYLLPSLVSLHQACITSPPYSIATFLPPLNNEMMQTWWQDRIKEVESGTRQIIIHLAPSVKAGAEEVAGVVMLDMQFTQTVPWGTDVQKLLVRPEHRKKGIMKKMMVMLEEVARDKGRGLLMLNTEKGSPAESIYPKLGYIKMGEIPDYAISPLDGMPRDAVLFYKDIRSTEEKAHFRLSLIK